MKIEDGGSRQSQRNYSRGALAQPEMRKKRVLETAVIAGG
jgi:hypothetical protein